MSKFEHINNFNVKVMKNERNKLTRDKLLYTN